VQNLVKSHGEQNMLSKSRMSDVIEYMAGKNIYHTSDVLYAFLAEFGGTFICNFQYADYF